MPNVLVRDVEAGLLEQLKLRARQNGRSLQNELQQLLRSLVEPQNPDLDEEVAQGIKDKLRGRAFSDSADSLREDRER